MPDGWAWCRLQTFCFPISDGTHQTPTYTNEGYIFLSAKNVTSWKIDWDNVMHIPESLHNELSKRISPKKNDILLAKNGTIGVAAIVDRDCDFDIYVTLAVLRTINTSILPQYLLNAIATSTIQNEFRSTLKGIGVQNLHLEHIRRTLIPIPPYNEQKIISEKVDEIIPLLEYITDIYVELDSAISILKSKILELAIQGKLVEQDPNDEPASILLERIRAEKKAQLGKKYVKSYIYKGDDNYYYEKIGSEVKNITEEIPFEIPKTWSWCRLGEYCQKVTDQVASGSFAALRENVPSLKAPDYAIMVKTADFSHNFTQDLTYTTKAGYDFLGNSNLFGGELILSNIGSVGKVFIVPKLQKKMTLAPNSIMLRFYEEIQKDYFYYFFLSPIGLMHLLSISRGATILKFNKTDLKTLPIPIPPINEQLRMVTQIQKLFEMVELKDEA